VALGLDLERACLTLAHVLNGDLLSLIDIVLKGDFSIVSTLIFLEWAESLSVVGVGVRSGACP